MNIVACPPNLPNELSTNSAYLTKPSASQLDRVESPPSFPASLGMKLHSHYQDVLGESSKQCRENSPPAKQNQPPRPLLLSDPVKTPARSILAHPWSAPQDTDAEQDNSQGPRLEDQDDYALACRQERHGDRSLVFRGLSPNTELLDITSVIRGGAILGIHLKSKDKTAHVSFVESSAAHEFYVWAKRNDIYIKDKRITVEWDEKQSFIPPYLARQIEANRASRNLLVRFVTPEMKPDVIRTALEYIHHLRIVDIKPEGHHIVVRTNGISNAITAKTCMMSRLRYMNTGVEYWPDECAEVPLPPIRRSYDRKPLLAKDEAIAHKNRFELLVDNSDD